MIREHKKKEKKLKKDFDGLKISIASPNKIRDWSFGEVTKPDTLNYRTLKPEKEGLFCERIFGPEKDFECSCGKYKKRRFAGTVCDRCGVEVTSSRERRKRMGHIELAVPISHIWFAQAVPSIIGTLLELSKSKLQRIIYYESYVVLNPGNSDYEEMDLIDTDEFYEIQDQLGPDFEAEMGANALKKLLADIDLESQSLNLRAQIKMETSKTRKQKAIKKLKVIEAFKNSSNKPEWMIFDVLPVMPPTLRPLVPLEGGKFATADFNDLYRRVITRNNRLKQLLEINAPQVIMRNEKRMLQEAVDALIDNTKKSRPVRGRGNRPLKSLTEQIKGKSGRFRQNLLGKRVDYSGRSVIVSGPELKLNECGLPKDMAVELFKPFIIKKLDAISAEERKNSPKKMLERKQPEIWKILEEVIEDFPILLNRQPTLHKLGIQAFQPKLTEGRAIKLHPLVCAPYNADFDGDQMAVHVPLSREARMEAKVLMSSTQNLLLPADGKLAMRPGQDIVLGIHYLTISYEKFDKIDRTKLRSFDNLDEILLNYEMEEMENNCVGECDAEKRRFDLHTVINYKFRDKWLVTTVGRAIFNNILPDKIPYINETLNKGDLNDLAYMSYETVGQYRTVLFLDDMKDLGFKYATRSALTFSAVDIIVPKDKKDILDKTEKEVEDIVDTYMNGGITQQERYNRVVDKWKIATEDITDSLMENLQKDKDGMNSIYLMYISGARGGKDQIKQLGGIRGLMDKPSTSGGQAEVIETPIKSNFIEGLSVLEYFISTHGARKGLADTALKTADAGYLTRRLVDVAQDCVISEDDCGTVEGIYVQALKEGLDEIESLHDRIVGRTAAEDVFDPVSDKVLVSSGENITSPVAKKIEKHGVLKVKLRSVLTCESEEGVCAKCYGRNLATNEGVKIGEPVGVVAAQSIGEPGTQLTLRTFHIGGTASTDVDVAAVDADFDGIIKFDRMNLITDKNENVIAVTHFGEVKIIDPENDSVLETYKVPYASTLSIKDGEKVVKDTRLFSWDQYNNPLIAIASGKVYFENFVKDLTYKEEFNDITGSREITLIESHDKKIQPQLRIVTDSGKEELIPLSKGLNIEIEDGDIIHAGDVLGKSSRVTVKSKDITGGLPRIQDLFEARHPKNKAIISEIDGKITIGDLIRRGRKIYVTSKHGLEKKYIIPSGKRIIVHQGDEIKSGDALSDGALDPHDILKAKGIKEAQKLILNEVQEIYIKQGVKIDDKHIGVIIRQMLKKVKILDSGHTYFLEGDIVNRKAVIQENDRIEAEGGKGAKFEQLLLGITKASLLTESWLSAASFQQTTKILIKAAIEGKVDPLKGLKENIIVGNKIPAGTGSKHIKKMLEKEISGGNSVSSIVSKFAHDEQVEEEEDFDSILDF